jgi:3-keto-5-aminohexanoate cleavage enzyme
MNDTPLVINFAPTGMVPTRAMTPHVPLRPVEVIREVREANQLGITVVHLHGRDGDDLPSSDPDHFAEMIGGIRETCPDLVLCVSLSGRIVTDSIKRAAPLSLKGKYKPDMGSLTLSSLNFSTGASTNEPATIQYLASRMLELGIMPELEVFDLGMVNYARYLIEKGFLRSPFYFNIILGNVASAQCDLAHAGILVRELPPESLWAFGGIGSQQLTACGLAVASGGGVRVGLEDNIYMDRSRCVLATNFELLSRVHTLARLFNRAVMTPQEFRARMQLRSGSEGFGREPTSSQGDESPQQ